MLYKEFIENPIPNYCATEDKHSNGDSQLLYFTNCILIADKGCRCTL